MVICDNCGSGKDVQRAFVTIWNGNILDLCKPCRVPVARLLDAIWLSEVVVKTEAASQPQVSPVGEHL